MAVQIQPDSRTPIGVVTPLLFDFLSWALSLGKPLELSAPSNAAAKCIVMLSVLRRGLRTLSTDSGSCEPPERAINF